MCDFADKPVTAARDHVREWHRLALPKIRTKPFADTWSDAVAAWKNIDGRKQTFRVIADEALQQDPPFPNSLQRRLSAVR